MATENNDRIPNVPALRFPEFSGEWERKSIISMADFLGGGTPSSSNNAYWQGKIPWVSSSDISEDSITDITISRYITEEAVANSATKLCSAPAILIVSRVGVGKVAFSKESICTSQDFCNLINIKENPLFLAYSIAKIMKRKSIEVQGTSIKGITSAEIQKIVLYIPSLKEQCRVSDLLQLLDERISTQTKIIEKYESLIQAIIFQKKTDGMRMGSWQKMELNNVLQERNEKNINGYAVCSVSVSQGVVNQIEYLGRSFAAKETSHYNIVKYGDIVYTKSPTGNFPYGIVKRSCIKDTVAVSPLYGVYKPISDNIGVILHFYFMQPNNAFNYLHPLIQKGAKNTINITDERFLENYVPLPKTKDETICIANALTNIQKKINIEKCLLREYKKKKQYLLRQMFI